MDSVIIIKFVSALLYPLGLILLAVLLSRVCFWLKKKTLGRVALLFGLLVFLLSSNLNVALWLTQRLEVQFPQRAMDMMPERDAIIVLGGGLRMPTEPAKHVQLGASSDRYWYAVQLYRAGKAKKIILNGGNLVAQKGLESEAFYARELLMDWGVSGSDILLEQQSRTTAENRRFVEPILKNNGFNSVLLVTSAIHMPRAYALYKTLPYQITPAPADIIVRHGQSLDGLRLMPSAAAINLTTQAMHEYYGLTFNWLKALIAKS